MKNLKRIGAVVVASGALAIGTAVAAFAANSV